MKRRRASAGIWSDALKLSMEMPAVVGLRLAKIARRGSAGAAEARLMVREKIKAAADVQRSVAKSIWAGNTELASAKVVRLYQKRVRANLKRLLKGK